MLVGIDLNNIHRILVMTVIPASCYPLMSFYIVMKEAAPSCPLKQTRNKYKRLHGCRC